MYGTTPEYCSSGGCSTYSGNGGSREYLLAISNWNSLSNFTFFLTNTINEVTNQPGLKSNPYKQITNLSSSSMLHLCPSSLKLTAHMLSRAKERTKEQTLKSSQCCNKTHLFSICKLNVIWKEIVIYQDILYWISLSKRRLTSMTK